MISTAARRCCDEEAVGARASRLQLMMRAGRPRSHVHRRRRSAEIATTPRPAMRSAHVDGSGTGVKLSSRLVPDVVRLNTPPFRVDVKPEVLSVTAAALKPTKLGAERMA